MKHCAACGNRATRRRNFVCEPCKANGWYWCTLGKHTANTARKQRNQCQDCFRSYQAAWMCKYDRLCPPAGYVRLKAAGEVLGYTSQALLEQIKRGVRPAKRVGHLWFVEIETR